MTQQTSLFEVLALHRVDITQMLSGLVEKGMLVPHGRNRGAYYTLPLVAPTILQVEASSPHEDTSSPHSDTSSPHSDTSSPHSDTSSPHSDTSSLHSDTSSLHSDTSSLHYAEPGHPLWEELAQQLGADTAASLLAETAHVRGHRPSGEEIRRILKVLCQGRYLSLAQLAYLMDRNSEGLRTRYLTPMVREGQLQLRYPNVPNHRQQGYRTVEGTTA